MSPSNFLRRYDPCCTQILSTWLPSVRIILRRESRINKLGRKGEGAFFDHTQISSRMCAVWTAMKRGREHLIGTGPGYWVGRVFDPDMATCPLCRRGSLRIIAAIAHESVTTRILRHLKLASVPPPIAPACCRQEIFAFDSSTTRGVVS